MLIGSRLNEPAHPPYMYARSRLISKTATTKPPPIDFFGGQGEVHKIKTGVSYPWLILRSTSRRTPGFYPCGPFGVPLQDGHSLRSSTSRVADTGPRKIWSVELV